MVKKKVCISFDYENDKNYRNLISAWNDNPNFDFTTTQGQDPNGNIIQEQVVTTHSQRNVVSFYYKTDPDFVVSYRY